MSVGASVVAACLALDDIGGDLAVVAAAAAAAVGGSGAGTAAVVGLSDVATALARMYRRYSLSYSPAFPLVAGDAGNAVEVLDPAAGVCSSVAVAVEVVVVAAESGAVGVDVVVGALAVSAAGGTVSVASVLVLGGAVSAAAAFAATPAAMGFAASCCGAGGTCEIPRWASDGSMPSAVICRTPSPRGETSAEGAPAGRSLRPAFGDSTIVGTAYSVLLVTVTVCPTAQIATG